MEHLLSSSFHNRLKNFVIASKQYSYCQNESSSNSVLCSLQVCVLNLICSGYKILLLKTDQPL